MRLPSLSLILVLAGLLGSPAAAHGQDAAGYLGKSVNLLRGQAEPGTQSLTKPLTSINRSPAGAGTLKSNYEERSDISEVVKNYSAQIGLDASYGAFSASAELGISKSVRERTQTKIVLISKNMHTATVSIDPLALDLADAFEAALNDSRYPPEALFKNYGTHVSVGCRLGGRVTGVFSSQDNSQKSNEELSVAAKASYGGVTASAEYRNETRSFNKSARINQRWIFKGGTNGCRVAVETNPSPRTYVAWANSITRSPGFYSFTENGLKPVWELASDRRRQEELHEAFKYAFTKRSLENLQRFSFTTPGKHKISTQSMQIPQGYKILSGGARTHFTSVGNLLTGFWPTNLRNWSAAHKDHHVPHPATVSLYVLAVHDPFDKLDVKIVSASSPPNTKVNEVSAWVQAGYVLTGGGAQAIYSGGGSLLTGSFPQPAAAPTQWTSRSMDHLVSCPAQLKGFAIMLRLRPPAAGPAPFRVETKAFMNSSGSQGVNRMSMGVGSGYKLVGGGAYTLAANGRLTQNFLTASYPANDQWHAESKDHHVSKPAKLTAFAVGLKVISPRPRPVPAPAKPSVAPTSGAAIGAALDFADGKAYFFKGTQCKRVDKARRTVDPGFPRATAEHWPGLPARIDAALNSASKNGRAYFFSGANYVRFDLKTHRADAGYPKPIAKGWPGVTFSRIDAALDCSGHNGKIYFFSGEQYIRYDVKTDRADKGYPKAIVGGWSLGGFTRVDAALNTGDGKALFFSGDRHVSFDLKADRADSAPAKTSAVWKGLID